MRIFTLLLYLLLYFKAWSQSPLWVSTLPDKKVFIENKGQFDGILAEKIYFAAEQKGVQFYFTLSGLTFKHTEGIGEDRTEEIGAPRENFKELRKSKQIDHLLQMEWIHPNPEASIIAQTPEPYYFTYPAKNLKDTYKAGAFRKIIYKDIYPGIDAEYIFPGDSSGIKYSLIIHPGADPSQIRFKYHSRTSEHKGALTIFSPFGNITEHAPRAFYEEGEEVKVNFRPDGDFVSFIFEDKPDAGRTLVIDPWIVVPAFDEEKSGFDVDFDLDGNVYVQGGPESSFYQLLKYDNTGALQWVFNAPRENFEGLYGDLSVNRENGMSYICNCSPFPFQCYIFKITSSGLLSGSFFPNPFSGGYYANIPYMELWRMEYNSCLNKLFIGCGVSASVCVMDSGLTGISYIAFPSPADASKSIGDVTLFTGDSYNNFYMLFNVHYPQRLVRIAGTAPATPVYITETAFDIWELNIRYSTADRTRGQANGFNGMAANGSSLFMYDGILLSKYDPGTGAELLNRSITGLGTDQAWKWAGLTVDDCDNLFAGVRDSVFRFDGSLNLVSTVKAPGIVYDLKLGPSGLLYACGKEFLASYLVPNICNPSICDIPPTTVKLGTLQLSAGTDGRANWLRWEKPGQNEDSKIFVQRSFSGHNFSTIAQVSSEYQYIDTIFHNMKALSYKETYYRLQHISGGKSSYSNIARVTVPPVTEPWRAYVTNPLIREKEFFIHVQIPASADVELSVIDSYGILRCSSVIRLEAGSNKCLLPCRDLPSGVYFTRISLKEESKVIKLLVE